MMAFFGHLSCFFLARLVLWEFNATFHGFDLQYLQFQVGT